MSGAMLLKILSASGLLGVLTNAGLGLARGLGAKAKGLTGWKAALAQGGIAAGGALAATYIGVNPFADGDTAALPATVSLMGGALGAGNVGFHWWKDRGR